MKAELLAELSNLQFELVLQYGWIKFKTDVYKNHPVTLLEYKL